ncbi:MAG: phosphotransferase [Anaerolineales bacterium]|nr:phosphotransferase [Anaerolineales bacterium]
MNAHGVRWPRSFGQTTVDLFGEAGKAWLAKLPKLLSELAEKWDLVLGEPFPNLSYNLVLSAWSWQSNTAVVLKIGFPRDELRHEIAALTLTHGRGQVRLLASDDTHCALLLEQLRPGHTLWKSGLRHDEQATRIAAVVMQKLWHPLPPQSEKKLPFRHVQQWAGGLSRLRREFGGSTGPFPAHLVGLAESLFADLFDTAEENDVLLHGDLHHNNILAHGDGWLAIDPKGVRGEPAYDVGTWLRNPSPALFGVADLEARLARRVAIFSEMLGIERERLVAHGLAQAVLSGWWHYEDHGRGWQGVLTVAEALNNLRTSTH